jgi:signal peptidase II
MQITVCVIARPYAPIRRILARAYSRTAGRCHAASAKGFYNKRKSTACPGAPHELESPILAHEGVPILKFWGPHSSLGLCFAAAAATADQFHKGWMIGLFESEGVRKFTLAPFFDIVMVWNPGISYGLFKQDSEAGRWALAIFSLCAVFALIYWLTQIQTRLAAISVGLIAGGALGNATDRIRFGQVADFFDFHIGDSFHWYIFNLADVAIVGGVAGLLYDSLISSHKSAGKQA